MNIELKELNVDEALEINGGMGFQDLNEIWEQIKKVPQAVKDGFESGYNSIN